MTNLNRSTRRQNVSPHKPGRVPRKVRAAARRTVRNNTSGGTTLKTKAARAWRNLLNTFTPEPTAQ